MKAKGKEERTQDCEDITLEEIDTLTRTALHPSG